MAFTVIEIVPGMLIFINFQKAIDSLELDFIFGCVEAFNFGPDFGRWVETFYKNIQTCVINNGMFLIISFWDVVLGKEISYRLTFLCWRLKL